MTRLKVIVCFLALAYLSSVQTLNISRDHQATDLKKSTQRREVDLSGEEQTQDASHAETNSKRGKGYSTKERYNEENRDKYGKDSEAESFDQKSENGKSENDETDHHNQRHVNGSGVKAAKFGEKKGHKRGHKTKGYHNKFFKDEYHREHKFYDVYHKSGNFKKNGDHRSGYNTNVRDRRRRKNKNSGYNNGNFQRNGHHHNGKQSVKQEGNKWKQGHQSHNNNCANYRKTGGSNTDNLYKFKRIH